MRHCHSCTGRMSRTIRLEGQASSLPAPSAPAATCAICSRKKKAACACSAHPLLPVGASAGVLPDTPSAPFAGASAGLAARSAVVSAGGALPSVAYSLKGVPRKLLPPLAALCA